MSNHFHLLCEVPQAQRSLAQWYNRRHGRYGVLWAVHGSLNTKTRQPAFDIATAQSVFDQENGELSLPERLRCRIRYFTDGVFLRSQSFVESHYYNLKHKLVTNVGALPRA